MKVFAIILVIWILIFSINLYRVLKINPICESDLKEKKLTIRISTIAISFGIFLYVLAHILIKYVYDKT